MSQEEKELVALKAEREALITENAKLKEQLDKQAVIIGNQADAMELQHQQIAEYEKLLDEQDITLKEQDARLSNKLSSFQVAGTTYRPRKRIVRLSGKIVSFNSSPQPGTVDFYSLSEADKTSAVDAYPHLFTKETE